MLLIYLMGESLSYRGITERRTLSSTTSATSGSPATLVQDKYLKYLRHYALYTNTEISKDIILLKAHESLNERCVLYYNLHE